MTGSDPQARTGGAPHQGQPVHRLGAPPGEARVVVLLLHGRGGSPEDILGLARPLRAPGTAYVAPAASDNTWYPQSFLAPIAANEPWLSAALARVEELVGALAEEGVPPERQLVCGFSQGACLALEHTARHPRRYGGVVAFTGGLIGPPGTPRDYPGDLAGTPIFLGAGDPDPHVPWARVEESAAVLSRMGGDVRLARYPGLGHAIDDDELAHAREILGSITAG